MSDILHATCIILYPIQTNCIKCYVEKMLTSSKTLKVSEKIEKEGLACLSVRTNSVQSMVAVFDAVNHFSGPVWKQKFALIG